MLVLSRVKDEKIVIDVPGVKPITVMVVDIRGDKVRLGIDAPEFVGVHRHSVWQKIREAAANANDR